MTDEEYLAATNSDGGTRPVDLDLDQAALRAQLESLASTWQRGAEDHRRTAVISDSASYSMGYADALDRASQSLKGLLDQW